MVEDRLRTRLSLLVNLPKILDGQAHCTAFRRSTYPCLVSGVIKAERKKGYGIGEALHDCAEEANVPEVVDAEGFCKGGRLACLELICLGFAESLVRIH